MQSTTEADPLLALAGDYWDDPLSFVQECFDWADGSGPDTWQVQFLEDLGASVRERQFDPTKPQNVAPIRMAVASGHGIGKSAMTAWLFWWIMVTRPGCKIRVTANTYAQLESTTWEEIRSWYRKLRFRSWFLVTGGRAVHKSAAENTEDRESAWCGIPITCSEENSDAFAGQHNTEGTSAFFFDESSSIPDKIAEVANTGLTDGEPMWFAFGNPTRNTGWFYESCFAGNQHRWNARSIDSRTCKMPNHDEHDQWIEDHGIESDYCKVRIRGLPPAQSESQLIGRELVESAQQRQVQEFEDTPLVCGVDVPDGGSGWFVVRFRRGLDARPGEYVPAPIRMAGSRVDRPLMIAECARILSERKHTAKVAAMFVDMGFGSAIVERLRSMNFTNVFEVNFGGKSPDVAYGNMRAFMWGREMKDWLAKGAIDKEDKKLASDIVAPGFHNRVGGDGALIVESKDSLKKRGIASPDDGDALALTFARHVAPAITETPAEERFRPDSPIKWS